MKSIPLSIISKFCHKWSPSSQILTELVSQSLKSAKKEVFHYTFQKLCNWISRVAEQGNIKDNIYRYAGRQKPSSLIACSRQLIFEPLREGANSKLITFFIPFSPCCHLQEIRICVLYKHTVRVLHPVQFKCCYLDLFDQ